MAVGVWPESTRIDGPPTTLEISGYVFVTDARWPGLYAEAVSGAALDPDVDSDVDTDVGRDAGRDVADGVPTLVRPSMERYPAWVECVGDFGDHRQMHGSGWWWLDDFDTDRGSCETLIAQAARLRVEPPEGLVVSDCFWIADGPDVVGFLMLRHSIDHEFLRTQGGHIGYSVRPSYRRRGFASRALGLALDEARRLGLERVLLTCDTDNIASARTIESRGGIFESTYGDKRRYWIAL